MPIYEFKCLKCNEFFEFLFRNSDDKVDMACPKCSSEDFERILSRTNHQMGGGSASKPQVSSQTRNCSGGTCTTYEIPGPPS